MFSYIKSNAISYDNCQQPVLRLGVLGSTQCHHPQTEEFCQHLGQHLRRLDLILVTGGLTGPPRIVADAFHSGDRTCNQVIHLLPYFAIKPKIGQTIRCGWTMRQRRRVLADCCQMYLSIEGGPNTGDELALIQHRGATVIPIGRFGGCAEQFQSQMNYPTWAERSLWDELMDKRNDVCSAAAIASDLVEFAAAKIGLRTMKQCGASKIVSR